MNKTIHFLLAALLITSFLLQGCADNCKETYTVKMYKPVYMSLETARNTVGWQAAKEIRKTGKIYAYQSFLFINEPGKGLHFFDNQNPSSPLPLGFLNIPGNRDMETAGHYLYCDNGPDLLVFDIQNITQPQLMNRITNTFPLPTMIGDIPIDPTKGLVTDWQESLETVERDNCNNISNCSTCDMTTMAIFNGFSPQYQPEMGVNNNSSSGKGGSMANFIVRGGYLYALRDNQVYTYQLANTNAQLVNTLSLNTMGGTAETLFPHKNWLLIGATNGMYILNLDNPATPSYVSTYTHVQSCDPVVAKDNYAYVTLSSGTPCGGGLNQLELIDISNIQQPQIARIYPMTKPKGLGIDNETLFVTDGTNGLYVFDIQDPTKLNENKLAQLGQFSGYDVIPFNQVLMCVAEDGLYQYDYQDLQNIKLLSKITVVK